MLHGDWKDPCRPTTQLIDAAIRFGCDAHVVHPCIANIDEQNSSVPEKEILNRYRQMSRISAPSESPRKKETRKRALRATQAFSKCVWACLLSHGPDGGAPRWHLAIELVAPCTRIRISCPTAVHRSTVYDGERDRPWLLVDFS